MFAYPWDIQRDGISSSVELVREIGCHRLAMAVAYHSAEVIAPRRRHFVQTTVEGNVAHLPLGGGFSELVLPTGSLAREHPELPGELARASSPGSSGCSRAREPVGRTSSEKPPPRGRWATLPSTVVCTKWRRRGAMTSAEW